MNNGYGMVWCGVVWRGAVATSQNTQRILWNTASNKKQFSQPIDCTMHTAH